MQWQDVSRDPSARTLRQFAGLWLVFFGLLAAWQGGVRGRPAVALCLAVLALTVGPLGLVKPALVRPVFVGWMMCAFPVGWLVSRLILAAVFYLVVTPTGLLLRLCGHDPLRRCPDPAAETYWTAKPPTRDPRRYLRPF
jgi:hypothetical protein